MILLVEDNKYELPVGVYDDVKDMAERTGKEFSGIYRALKKAKTGGKMYFNRQWTRIIVLED